MNFQHTYKRYHCCADPKESHAIPKSEAQEGPRIEAVYKQEESFDQEWCASLKQVTELTCVKDEEVPRLECVPIKKEFIEQESVPITEEVPTENNVCTLEENNQLGSSLCDDCPPECELGFKVRTDQPHSKEASEMEAAHISPELPIRWVVSADRTVEIKEEVTELGCDQANERILQEETSPSSITERVRTDQPHSKEVSEMEVAHISPELPVRWVVSADRTVEIKEEVTELGCDQANERILQEETPPSSITERVRTDQPHSKEVSEMEAAHISPELPIRWVVSADRTVEIKEEVTELGCDQANEQILQEETPPSSITERACNVDEVEHDSTPSPHCKNSSSGKPQRKKHRETTPQEENANKLRVQIPLVQDRQPLTLESIEPAHSVCVNDSETQGNLKTLPCSTDDGKSSHQLGSPKTHKGNRTGGTPFPCADCGKRFTLLGNLKKHQLIHTDEKPHHCNKCEKRFSRSEYLKYHQRIHTGDKPHHCNDCRKCSTQLENIKKHQLIHTGEKPHHCNECGRSFTHLRSLKAHHLIHTGDKPHRCKDCGKSFTQLGNLAKHQRIHTGEKPHHCNDCGRSFTRIDNLKMHQLVHTEKKPHHCNDCGKSLPELGHLKTHQLIHTAVKP
ncbi:UNVERIFIED_CONTAM: hypothetical protein FKN15_078370 [Acipenser sinensis]